MSAISWLSRAIRQPPQRSLHLLIVDDEEPVRRFVDRVLLGVGYTTTTASGGADALRVAATLGALDVLVTDLMMPEMAGDELARQLRQRHPLLKVLYLRGFNDHLFEKKPTLWADEAFVDKPCSVTGLIQAVSLLWSERIFADQRGVTAFDS